jgi:hypothetical protein
VLCVRPREYNDVMNGFRQEGVRPRRPQVRWSMCPMTDGVVKDEEGSGDCTSQYCTEYSVLRTMKSPSRTP